jgi:DNA primase
VAIARSSSPPSYGARDKRLVALGAQGVHGHGRLVVTDMTKARRAGKVFIDWSQNADYKTTGLAAKTTPARRAAQYEWP